MTQIWRRIHALFTAQKADTIAKAQKDAAAGSPSSSVAFRWLVAFCAAMMLMTIVKPEGWLKVVLFLPGLVCFGVFIWINVVYLITYTKAGRRKRKADKTGNPS